MNRYPELYTDKDIDFLVDEYYEYCKDKDCSACAEGEDCRTEVLLDLWRKWKNLQNKNNSSKSDL